jgi:hypothetical protein
MKAVATLEATVKRGGESWTYFYVALGFALSIEGTVVGMIQPLAFPWNLVAYLVVGAVTFWLVLFNGWFQNKLVRWKNAYEQKAH